MCFGLILIGPGAQICYMPRADPVGGPVIGHRFAPPETRDLVPAASI